MLVKQGGVRRSIDAIYSQTFNLSEGLCATDGFQAGAVTTVGTTPVTVISKVIDAGFPLALQKIRFDGIVKVTGLNGSIVGSAYYYWTMQPTKTVVQGSGAPYTSVGTTIGITPTQSITAGTLAAAYGTMAGYVPVGSVPWSPMTVELKAVGVKAADYTIQLGNTTIQLVGMVLP